MYSNIKVYQKYLVTSFKVGCATRSLYASVICHNESEKMYHNVYMHVITYYLLLSFCIHVYIKLFTWDAMNFCKYVEMDILRELEIFTVYEKSKW